MALENCFQTGTIKYAKELGRKGTHRYMWHACVDCGKERWVIALKRDGAKVESLRCCNCAQRRIIKPWPKGGRIRTKHGYIYQKVKLDNSFYSMSDRNGYVAEHRLVMAKHLGRCLKTGEVIHHINGIKDDNRIENLELFNNYIEHNRMTLLEKRIAFLENRVLLLEAENELIKQGVMV